MAIRELLGARGGMLWFEYECLPQAHVLNNWSQLMTLFWEVVGILGDEA
jgi:hypothetical protein